MKTGTYRVLDFNTYKTYSNGDQQGRSHCEMLLATPFKDGDRPIYAYAVMPDVADTDRLRDELNTFEIYTAPSEAVLDTLSVRTYCPSGCVSFSEDVSKIPLSEEEQAEVRDAFPEHYFDAKDQFNFNNLSSWQPDSLMQHSAFDIFYVRDIRGQAGAVAELAQKFPQHFMDRNPKLCDNRFRDLPKALDADTIVKAVTTGQSAFYRTGLESCVRCLHEAYDSKTTGMTADELERIDALRRAFDSSCFAYVPVKDTESVLNATEYEAKQRSDKTASKAEGTTKFTGAVRQFMQEPDEVPFEQGDPLYDQMGLK